MCLLLAFRLRVDLFRNASFSYISVSVSIFEQLRFHDGKVRTQRKTVDKFCFFSICKQSNVDRVCDLIILVLIKSFVLI